MTQCPRCLIYYNSHAAEMHDKWHELMDKRDDIVSRLRSHARNAAYMLRFDEEKDCNEAADEVRRLRAALEEIAGDPVGISSYQAELARRALEQKP